MIQKLQRHQHPSGRTIFESSDSTDDIDHSRLPPSHLPLSPPHHTHKTVTVETPPNSRKKNHPRRKKRTVNFLSPEREVPPHLSLAPLQEPPTGKIQPPGQEPRGGNKRPLNVKLLPNAPSVILPPSDLNLQVVDDNMEEGVATFDGGTTKSDDSIELPITPGGSISPAVSELIRSLQKTRTHRRTGSGGSVASLQRGATQNPCGASSVSAAAGCTTDEKGLNSCTRQHTPLSENGVKPMTNGIPYSKLGMSDSDSDTDTFQDDSNYSTSVHQDTRTLLALHAQEGQRSNNKPHPLESAQSPLKLHVYEREHVAFSNQSSVTGTDGHEADSESDCGETQSTADERSPAVYGPLTLSVPPTPTFSTSPQPPSSPTTTASDHTNISPLSSVASPVPPDFPPSLVPSDLSSFTVPLEPPGVTALGPPEPPDISSAAPSVLPEFPMSSDPATANTPTPAPRGTAHNNKDKRKTTYTLLPVFADHRQTDRVATDSNKRSSTTQSEPSSSLAAVTDHEQTNGAASAVDDLTALHGQVAMLISQFEEGGSDGSGGGVEGRGGEGASNGNTGSVSCPGSPKLEIPLHIRRHTYHHHHSELPSDPHPPTRVEQGLHDNSLGNSTSIVRHFFENIVTKGPPEVRVRRTYSTTELEDSGFQVSFITNTATTCSCCSFVVTYTCTCTCTCT